MEVTPFKIEGPLLLQPKVFGDSRGYFMESFNKATFLKATGRDVEFVQDNQSRSLGRVLRGLHYQLSPSAQGKLVRCIKGAIFDVAVDIRRSSATFGQWVGAELTEENNQMLWVPEGFAHGFCTLTDVTDVFYKVTAFYNKSADRSLFWADQKIGIKWPDGAQPMISEKDATAVPLDKADLFD